MRYLTSAASRQVIAVGLGVLTVPLTVSVQVSGTYEIPRPGWLYVVDSNAGAREGRIIAVDPDQGRTVWSLPTGHLPDVAVSPDGSRLFIASAQYESGRDLGDVLDIIDTRTGTLVQRLRNANRPRSTLPTYVSKMAVSKDGRLLFQSKQEVDLDEQYTAYYIETFDTESNTFLPERAMIPLCTTSTLEAGPLDNSVFALCRQTSDVRFVTVSPTGAALSRPLSVGADTPAKHEHPATFVQGSATGAVTLLTEEGRFVKRAAAGLREEGSADAKARGLAGDRAPQPQTPQNWLATNRMPFQRAAVSSRAGRVFVGVGPRSRGDLQIVEISVLDVQTMDRVQTIRPSRPVVNLLLDDDRGRLYGFDSHGRTILVIDPATGRELGSIANVGVSPIFAVLAP